MFIRSTYATKEAEEKGFVALEQLMKKGNGHDMMTLVPIKIRCLETV